MKRTRMKGKNVEAAVKAALEVLGGKEEDAKIMVLSEGKPAVLGVIGGQDAEVEVVLKEGPLADAKQVLQDIMDKMVFMAVVEGKDVEGGVELKIKGDDMGRIIGKEGATLRSLEILVSTILGRTYAERVRVNIDAGDYKEKRKQSLERLAKEVADEVAKTGQEKSMPHMSAADRRLVHLYLQENGQVTTVSKGEGRDRRLIVMPR